MPTMILLTCHMILAIMETILAGNDHSYKHRYIIKLAVNFPQNGFHAQQNHVKCQLYQLVGQNNNYFRVSSAPRLEFCMLNNRVA